MGDLLSTMIAGLVFVANFALGVLIHRNTSAINKQNDILSSIETQYIVATERQRDALREAKEEQRDALQEAEEEQRDALREAEKNLAAKITQFNSAVNDLISNSYLIIQSMQRSELKIEDLKRDFERVSQRFVEGVEKLP